MRFEEVTERAPGEVLSWIVVAVTTAFTEINTLRRFRDVVLKVAAQPNYAELISDIDKELAGK